MLPRDKRVFDDHIRRLLKIRGSGSSVFAARAMNATLALLLKDIYPRLTRMGARPNVGLTERREIKEFSSWLKGMQFVDCAFWLSSTYACLMPRSLRNKQALFFTPPSLAFRLISSLRQQGLKFGKAQFADPSCGGSAFLVPIATELARELGLAGWSSERILTHIEGHLVGFELDPILCQLSRVLLNMALYGHVLQADRLLKPKIIKGDFAF